MDDDQRAARIFGGLFVITVLAVLLFQRGLDDPAGYIGGGGKDDQIYLGALLSLGIYAATWGLRRAAPFLSARER